MLATLPATIFTFNSLANEPICDLTRLQSLSKSASKLLVGKNPVFHISGKTTVSQPPFAAFRIRKSARLKFSSGFSYVIFICIRLIFISSPSNRFFSVPCNVTADIYRRRQACNVRRRNFDINCKCCRFSSKALRTYIGFVYSFEKLCFHFTV